MRYLVILISVVVLSSCEPKVLFENALPPDTKPLSTIPVEFQGVFYSECDSTVLHATSDVIYTDAYFQFVTTVTSVQEREECKITDQGFYLHGTKECAPFEYLNGDTILVKLHQKDTMFHISKGQVAKLYKGRLFLNSRDVNNNWMTSIVTPGEAGRLHWDLIDIPNKVDKIKKITSDYTSYKRSDDSEIFVIKPTQIEFEKLLSKEYLTECDVFIPLTFQLEYLYEK